MILLWTLTQTPDGRPYSFYVKKVHPDTLGWKAGLQAEDRIIKVTFSGTCSAVWCAVYNMHCVWLVHAASCRWWHKFGLWLNQVPLGYKQELQQNFLSPRAGARLGGP